MHCHNANPISRQCMSARNKSPSSEACQTATNRPAGSSPVKSSSTPPTPSGKLPKLSNTTRAAGRANDTDPSSKRERDPHADHEATLLPCSDPTQTLATRPRFDVSMFHGLPLEKAFGILVGPWSGPQTATSVLLSAHSCESPHLPAQSQNSHSDLSRTILTPYSLQTCMSTTVPARSSIAL